MAGITITHVTKHFPGFKAVDDLNLTIEDGEFLVLVGPSGCGKTTVLRMIAGLETVTQGQATIGEVDVTSMPPKDRDVAMVFQDYALYPHLSVEKNLGIGLKLRRVPKNERKVRVQKVAALLGLEELLARRPSELSGGQRQRVAIGRAMVREPRVYLMDEPLSNLDAKLRVQMRAELGRLRDRLRVTTVYVTHDQVEAMTLGDRVAVLNDGVLQQVDTAQELFDHPVNTFVAGFIGSPEMNMVHATLADGRVHFGGHSLALAPDSGLPASGDVILGIRPTDLGPVQADAPDGSTMTVRAEVLESLGAEVRIVFQVDARPGGGGGSPGGGEAAQADLPLLLEPGEAPHGATTFTACLKQDAALRPGDDVTLAVDPGAQYFFDPQSGAAIGARAQPAMTPSTDTKGRP